MNVTDGARERCVPRWWKRRRSTQVEVVHDGDALSLVPWVTVGGKLMARSVSYTKRDEVCKREALQNSLGESHASAFACRDKAGPVGHPMSLRDRLGYGPWPERRCSGNNFWA